MTPCKKINEIIYEINKEKLQDLSDKFDKYEDLKLEEICNNHKNALKQIYSEEDLNLFVYYDPDVKKYLAIDNTEGIFLIEEFTKVKDAYIWLLRLKPAHILQKAEEKEFWY